MENLLVKDEYRRDIEGIRSTLLQIRSALRGAQSALDAIRPMLATNREVAQVSPLHTNFDAAAEHMSEAISEYAQMIYAWYRVSFEPENMPPAAANATR